MAAPLAVKRVDKWAASTVASMADRTAVSSAAKTAGHLEQMMVADWVVRRVDH